MTACGRLSGNWSSQISKEYRKRHNMHGGDWTYVAQIVDEPPIDWLDER